MSLETKRSADYRVEISGWDAANKFFVERTTLEWCEDETKRVSLRSSVREGSIVFLRLLQEFGDGTGLPVACSAVRVLDTGLGEPTQVDLVPLHPRATAGGAHTAEAIAFRPA